MHFADELDDNPRHLPANFTVQEKFYLERLIKEVVALRKRVEELEAKRN